MLNVRYIQRKKAAEDKEWEQKLQQEFYESWLEQRFRKAISTCH